VISKDEVVLYDVVHDYSVVNMKSKTFCRKREMKRHVEDFRMGVNSENDITVAGSNHVTERYECDLPKAENGRLRFERDGKSGDVYAHFCHPPLVATDLGGCLFKSIPVDTKRTLRFSHMVSDSVCPRACVDGKTLGVKATEKEIEFHSQWSNESNVETFDRFFDGEALCCAWTRREGPLIVTSKGFHSSDGTLVGNYPCDSICTATVAPGGDDIICIAFIAKTPVVACLHGLVDLADVDIKKIKSASQVLVPYGVCRRAMAKFYLVYENGIDVVVGDFDSEEQRVAGRVTSRLDDIPTPVQYAAIDMGETLYIIQPMGRIVHTWREGREGPPLDIEGLPIDAHLVEVHVDTTIGLLRAFSNQGQCFRLSL
jgi:hypothetical protein